MTLAVENITLKGAAYSQITPLSPAGLQTQLAKDLPRCNVVCCVENTAATETHRSQLILMLARRGGESVWSPPSNRFRFPACETTAPRRTPRQEQ